MAGIGPSVCAWELQGSPLPVFMQASSLALRSDNCLHATFTAIFQHSVAERVLHAAVASSTPRCMAAKWGKNAVESIME